jgi:hypothetical protein
LLPKPLTFIKNDNVPINNPLWTPRRTPAKHLKLLEVRGDRYQAKKRSVADAKGFASTACPTNTLGSSAHLACLTKAKTQAVTNNRIPPGLAVNQVKSPLAEIPPTGPPWLAARSTLEAYPSDQGNSPATQEETETDWVENVSPIYPFL